MEILKKKRPSTYTSTNWIQSKAFIPALLVTTRLYKHSPPSIVVILVKVCLGFRDNRA